MGSQYVTHKKFYNPLSDHTTHLNAYYAYQQAEREDHNMAEWCYENFINHKAVMEASELEQQLIHTCISQGIQTNRTDFAEIDDCRNPRKALAYGSCYQTAVLVDPDNGVYMTPHGSWEGLLAPSSKLGAVGADEWIVFDKLHQGAHWYFETATAIDLEWLLVRNYTCV